MSSYNDIRKSFIDYFVKNNHNHVKSASLIPQNDDSLLFTNAGMVPFKDIFTAVTKPEHNRAVSSQKCLRAGGKHNDLDNVGYTARHHTFFEMLGNFSFGDYFREQAILYAWEYLTKEIGLNKDKLIITVHQTDDESYNFWKKITSFGDDRLLKINSDDNFWSMGSTGPCGPCTEIYYDYGDSVKGYLPGSNVEDEGDRYVEIWNIVLMQFEKIASQKELIPLKAPSIDTGMGLERIASVLQGVTDNYKTDLFQGLMNDFSEIIGTKITTDNEKSFKVIADHIRAISFLITDGVLPSNEGRGYVLRRIMRRAMRYESGLHNGDFLIHKLVKSLASTMGSTYLELNTSLELIEKTIEDEGKRFNKVLDKGTKLLNQELENVVNNTLAGDVAFKLYDTYGFPLDLTQDILREKNIKVDLNGFENAMKNQRELAKKEDMFKTNHESRKHLSKLDGLKTEFTGYEKTTDNATVLALLNDTDMLESAKQDQELILITDKTPFYAESGGQIGDTGYIFDQNGNKLAKVLDTQKHNKTTFMHKVNVLADIKLKQNVVLQIDETRRKLLKAHHSAAHLLQSALIEVLGSSVAQKGSYVSEERTRFDFAYNKALTKEQIAQAEHIVNGYILKGYDVTIKQMNYDDAIKEGALFLAGEDNRYGDNVRTVKMACGSDIKSFELCGGTHVNNTSEIGIFKIISESSISAGVRRIEAVCSFEAFKYLSNASNVLEDVSLMLSTNSKGVLQKVEHLIEDNKKLKKEIKNSRIGKLVDESIAGKEEINGIDFVYLVAKDDVDAKDIREISNIITTKFKNHLVAIFAIKGGSVSLSLRSSEKAQEKIVANEYLKVITPILGLKGGGGSKDACQAGGGLPNKIEEAVNHIKKTLQS